MSRELVLVTLSIVLGGAGVWLMSWVPAARDPLDGSVVSGRQLERRSWRRLWLPTLPAAMALATLVGWACQEPSVTDEPLRPLVVFFALPVVLLWFRCAGRAFRALRRPPVMPTLATIGLLRPRVVAATCLGEVIDPDALSAALSHERAHVRHLGPLRIWLAQIVTDVQWPNPRARRRLEQWLVSLELARDEEARIDGAHGEDLAAAVVAVAKLTLVTPGTAMAGLTGTEALASRIHRLLEPLRPDEGANAVLVPVLVLTALAVGVALGVEHGDSFLRALPFIAQ